MENNYDSICSVSSLEGTIIGVLFEKTGKEISDAVIGKVKVLNGEERKYIELIESSEIFLGTKEKELKIVDEIYQKRFEAKEVAAKPFFRQIEKVQNEWNKRLISFNKKTEKMIAEKAVNFNRGFEEFQDEFVKVDLEYRKLRDGYTSISYSSSSSSTDSTTSSLNLSSSSTTLHPKEMIDLDNDAIGLKMSKEEDQALVKLDSLKKFVFQCKERVKFISDKINSIREEKRCLNLIKNNLEDDRKYKLDLSKLIAFGFEK